jgi:PhnB protein
MATTTIRTKVIAYLAANGASDAIEFYKRAFGAVENFRMPNPDGTLGHAEIAIGDTIVYLADEWPDMRVLSPKALNGNSVSLVLEVPDADAAFQRALDAGATAERPLKDEDYGRVGWLVDPFGHRWCIMRPDHQHPHE